MSDSSQISAVARQIRAATKFSDVFGPMPPGDRATKRAALRKKFVYLASIVHPDHVREGDVALRETAQKTFTALNAMRQKADEALLHNAYDSTFMQGEFLESSQDGAEMRSKKGAYKLSSTIFRSGDFSAIYRGKTIEGTPRPVIVKVAAEPTLNAWLEKEVTLLAELRDAKKGSDIYGLKSYVPELIDTFLAKDGKNRHFRVVVTNSIPDLVSVTDIIDAYPDGLDPKDAAWVSRRIIAQTVAARMLGVVHSAMVPDHILVDPYKHEPLHIGWTHAVKKSERITHVIDRWRNFYPPEIFDKKIPDHRTDIYMAGKTIIRLHGGDEKANTFPSAVPDEIARVILRAVESSPSRRFGDGMQFLDEYTRVVRKLWGRGYRPLIMPVR
jgi:hypothetical protein